jgi:hypothetical protein
MLRYQLVKHAGATRPSLPEYAVYRVEVDPHNLNNILSMCDILPVEVAGESPEKVYTLLQTILTDIAKYPVVTSDELDTIIADNMVLDTYLESEELVEGGMAVYWDDEEALLDIESFDCNNVIDAVDFFNRNR